MATDRDDQPGNPWEVALPSRDEKTAGRLGLAACRETLQRARPPQPKPVLYADETPRETMAAG